MLIVRLYMDDNLIFTCNNPKLFQDFKKAMTNIGLVAYYIFEYK